jgi:hypothetical protein
MHSNYTTSTASRSVPCEKCKSTRTTVTEVTTYGHYYKCESCKHKWYAQATEFRFAD